MKQTQNLRIIFIFFQKLNIFFTERLKIMQKGLIYKKKTHDNDDLIQSSKQRQEIEKL